jgi:hypothetical protein
VLVVPVPALGCGRQGEAAEQHQQKDKATGAGRAMGAKIFHHYFWK